LADVILPTRAHGVRDRLVTRRALRADGLRLKLGFAPVDKERGRRTGDTPATGDEFRELAAECQICDIGNAIARALAVET